MTFHLYEINEIFSNADGTVQFIELVCPPGNDGEHQWSGHTITASFGGVTHTFTFPSNLPSSATGGTSVLVATQGFADLGIVTPNYIVPNGFLFTGSGTVNFGGGFSVVTYSALPSDGTHSVDSTGATITASPTNFAGATAPVPMPTTNTVTGTDGNDDLSGTAGNDTIIALAGDDYIRDVGGTDAINGGAGTDTVIVNASFASLTTATASRVAGPGFDLPMTEMERIGLDDRILVFDTQSGEAAWELMAILCAGFGPTAGRTQLFDWLRERDLPEAMSGVAQAVIDHYAPGVSTAALVQYLYGSIVGVAPTQGQVDQYANEVGAGKTFATQGDLLAFAANLSINTDKIVDFVGVQQVFYVGAEA